MGAKLSDKVFVFVWMFGERSATKLSRINYFYYIINFQAFLPILYNATKIFVTCTAKLRS